MFSMAWIKGLHFVFSFRIFALKDMVNSKTNVMKKLLLFAFAMLGIAGMSMAQDVYYTGFHQHPTISYLNGAAVYKNGEMIFLVEDDTHSYAPISFVIDENTNDWYLAYSSDYDYYVVKNGTDEILHVSGEGTSIAKIYWYDAPSGDPEDCLYAVGQVKITSDLNFHAAVWKGSNATPIYLWNNSGVESSANDLFVYDEDVYYVGYYEHHATIFKNDEVLATLSTDLSEVTEMAVSDDGYIYTVGRVTDPGTGKFVLTVWREGDVYYTLTSPDVYGGPEAFAVSSGDVYVFGTDNSVRKIWKNEDEIFVKEEEGYLMSELAVTSHLYYCFNGDVYKDHELLYESQGEFGTVVCDLLVMESCDDPTVRALPYQEDFSFMTTDWECWTIEDEGVNEYNSYWYRNGSNDDYDYWYGDDDCAIHGANTSDYQEGRLISPAIALPANHSIRLSFYSYTAFLEDYDYSGVEIATADHPTTFTEVWQLDPSTDPGEWVIYDIDLSDYAGQTVYVAFTYRGLDAHIWAVDDVSVVGSPTGVDESGEEGLTVLPNPARDQVRIHGVEANTEVQIYNSLGMLVKRVIVSENAMINISDLSAGLYMIQCGDQTLRLVKE